MGETWGVEREEEQRERGAWGRTRVRHDCVSGSNTISPSRTCFPGPPCTCLQALGAAAATLAKANKSKAVGIAFVTPPAGGLPAMAQQITLGERTLHFSTASGTVGGEGVGKG
jgi:hypothetical protein